MSGTPPLKTFMETRRSIPVAQIGEPGPDRTALEAMLTIASRVPDHGKLAPWRFIVIRGDERARLGEAFAEIARANNPAISDPLLAVERARFTRAPVVVAVVSRAAPHVKIPEWEQVLSAGAVCMNLLIAAAAEGYAANWLTEWIAYDEKAKAAIGLVEGENIAGFVHVGTPKEPPFERPRPALSDIVTWVGGDAA